MREGVEGVETGDLDAAALRVLTELSTAQMRARIEMRNAQFGRPLAPERIVALCAGALPPLAWSPRATPEAAPIRPRSPRA